MHHSHGDGGDDGADDDGDVDDHGQHLKCTSISIDRPMQWDLMVGWVGHEISRIIIINLATQNSPAIHRTS